MPLMRPEPGRGLLANLRGSVPTTAARLLVASIAVFCALCLHFSGVARADGAELCGGYATCNAEGFSTHGYENAAGQSWWAMYPGINCTNYAAFVESQAYGVAEPDLLLGDAYEWADRAAEAGIPVDQTPTVGSVAQWDADAPGMGGYGHVAIVEAVASNGSYIDVSQSGMGTADDGYDREQIDRSGGSWEPWPSSFIHFSGPGMPSNLPQLGMRMAAGELAIAGG